MSNRILVLNLGSTSTKVAVFLNDRLSFKETILHKVQDLKSFKDIWGQKEFREKSILDKLEEKGVDLYSINIIASRGGNTKPIPGGIYFIDENMLRDVKTGEYGIHPSNVGIMIAYELGKKLQIPVITVDPPVTDEFCNLARYSGLDGIQRISSFHALNQKATARKLATRLGKEYDELNLIVVHLGGGISVGAHKKGKVVDVNNALGGDGPFSAERSGSIPINSLIKLCFSGLYSEDEMFKLVINRGGLMSYLGTSNGFEVESRICEGDKKALEVLEAMAYQVSKEIGSAATVLKGVVDGIVLTGSFANSKRFVKLIEKRIKFLGPLYLYPGENEMEALADSALRYLTGIEKALLYR